MKKRTFPSAATTLANPSGAASVGSAANSGRGPGSGRTSQAILPSGVMGGMGAEGVKGRAKRTAAVAARAAPDVTEALASTSAALGDASHGASHNASFTSIRPASSAPRQRAVLGQLSDMDLRLLQVFKSVAECGGMSAAELELNIGTSTVSRHMKDLETRLGLTLCRRGRAGFALTAEGQRVYDETLRLLSAVDAFRSSIDDIHRRMGGRLEVAVFDKTASNPAAHIGAAIALFASRAPDVSLHMHVAAIPAIERGLMDGSLHVGIIPAHRVSQSLVYTNLFTETMLLYCGAKHPLFGADHSALTWDALRAHQFAGLGYHSPNMQLSHSARLPRKATGFDQESIATLVLSGRYLGFLPDHYADNFQRQGLMQAVLPTQFFYPCQFVSVLRKSPQPPRAAQAFAQCLAQAHG